jgi:hypothetical protein
LTTDLNQMQRLRTSGAISLLVRCAFMASTRKASLCLVCMFCLHCVCLFTFSFGFFFFSLHIILYRAYSRCLLSHLVQNFHWYLANPVLVRVLLNMTDTIHGLRAWRMPYLRQLEECSYNLAASPRASAEEMDKTLPHTYKRIFRINHQPDATIFQFNILTFIYSSACFGRFPAHHQEFNDCSSSVWF